jgi:hypothetical protein
MLFSAPSELDVIEPLNACVVAAVPALEIIVENPDRAVLKNDPDIAKASGHGRSSFLGNYSHAPPGIPLVYDPVAYTQIERILLLHVQFYRIIPVDFKTAGREPLFKKAGERPRSTRRIQAQVLPAPRLV